MTIEYKREGSNFWIWVFIIFMFTAPYWCDSGGSSDPFEYVPETFR